MILSQCLTCGNDGAPVMNGNADYGYFVICSRCNACRPASTTKEEAAKDWARMNRYEPGDRVRFAELPAVAMTVVGVDGRLVTVRMGDGAATVATYPSAVLQRVVE